MVSAVICMSPRRLQSRFYLCDKFGNGAAFYPLGTENGKCTNVTLTLTRSRQISVLYLLSKRSLPEDINKFNEGVSLTICSQASSIVREACLRYVYGSTLNPLLAGRLPCGDNVVLALDSKDP